MNYFHESDKVDGVPPTKPTGVGNNPNITEEELEEMRWADDGGNQWVKYGSEKTLSMEEAK